MPKTLTRDQLQSRKDQAVRFVRDVLQDSDRADEIDGESLEDSAERRKITLINPGNGRRRRNNMASKKELEDRVQELEEENQELSDQLDAIADIISPDDDVNVDSSVDDDDEGEDDDNQD